MQIRNSVRLFSASDLVNFAACSHLTHLDLVHLETPLQKAAETAEMELIQGKGFAHEARFWEHLQKSHVKAVDLSRDGASDEQLFIGTNEALGSGVGVLFQATLIRGPWVGHADFLMRVETPSRLGSFSYEVADTKLAMSSRAKFLIQLCLYSELLAEVQGVMPHRMHVVLGDGRQESFIVDDYLRYFRRLQGRFLAWVGHAQRNTYPERSETCSNCRWREICGERWVEDDHLNQVAGIAKQQIGKLRAASISTVGDLAGLAGGASVRRIQPQTLDRLSHQARLQVRSRESGQPVFEVLPVLEGRGFNRMPVSHPGDLYFDMEGNPLEDGGLEYLFGLYFFEAGKPVFKAFWAHTRDEERHAFESFIDFVVAHLGKFPSAHIYHYAPYEPTALKRLMALHGTREEQVDNLLRLHKLVDLYAVVREGLRLGEASYSIKSVERFYSSKARAGDVKTAGASVVFYERWKATQDAAYLRAIEDYNLDDVRSTFELREWLLSLRPADAAWFISAPAANVIEVAPVSKKAALAAAKMEAYRQRLALSLPSDRLEWTNEHRVSELAFHLIGFHRRADKPTWWALFDRQDASEEELLENLEALAALTQTRPPEQLLGGARYWYSYPDQPTKLRTGQELTVVSTLDEVTDVVVDDDRHEVEFVTKAALPLPTTGMALGAGLPVKSTVIQGAVRRFIDAYLEGSTKFDAGLQFLRRELPRCGHVQPGLSLVATGESTVDAVENVVAGLQESYLFVQGPPGAGKTYTASHVITNMLKHGKRVAVTSNSHKAINNLLRAVEKVAVGSRFSFSGAKKSTSDESLLNGQFILDVLSTSALTSQVHEYQLMAGTAWLFSSAKLELKFDYLFVDEAGQVSLANLIAMSTCASNIVLLGDQMQLGQPMQGTHPGESGQSTLEYLLQGEATIAPERGIFLADSWRMHPHVCQFISDAVYSGRLKAEHKNINQRLMLTPGVHSSLRPTGVAFIEVEHYGNSQRCDEEAEVIRTIFCQLLHQQYVDREGSKHAMTLDNILVVAPYNLQVNRLKQVLPDGARVGTVDKFQGQEAEAVLVSMTTSSGEYLPRDIDFLYSKNRLNVAISRARCWAGVVASPRLLDINVASPGQMALVNTLCWVSEYAVA